jgi:hypothetical protein
MSESECSPVLSAGHGMDHMLYMMGYPLQALALWEASKGKKKAKASSEAWATEMFGVADTRRMDDHPSGGVAAD